MNTIGINAMRALVWAGVVQGFSTPPLMLLVLLLTASRKVMGDKANVTALNVAGALTVLIIFGASVALIVTWFI